MPTFKISTLGCKVNQSESEAIARQLETADWLPAGNGEESEITIINTCTVTHKAAMQSRQAIRQAIRANPNARIVVTGCYAQTEPEALQKINGVHYIIGNAYKNRIGEYEVVSLEGSKMIIRFSDGRTMETTVEMQARIWENIQFDESSKETKKKLGTNPNSLAISRR